MLTRRTRLVSRTPLQRSSPIRRSLRPARASKWRHAFQEAAQVCVLLDRGGCDGRVEAHHVVAKQTILRVARSLRLSERETARLVWDPRNAMGLCERHHRRHTLAVERVPAERLRPAMREFADELGVGYLLDRYYLEQTAC